MSDMPPTQPFNEPPVQDDLVTCPHCGADVARLPYCTVCGSSLGAADAHQHRRYAAAPSESAIALRFASTLLPRLPQAHMAVFNICLVLGLVVVVLLAAFGYYSVALGAGAFVVPLLMIVYIYDVDDYEDEPLRVTIFTVAWGVIFGALFGFLVSAVLPSTGSLLGDTPTQAVLRNVVLPLAGAGLALIGPLILLPYRKFNDVLDGATFGVTAGATFAGAQLIAQSLDIFRAGPQLGGDVVSQALYIVVHSLCVPIIVGGAVGVTAGAFWLRYRAPVRDRNKLGPAGRPIIAIVLAAILIVASATALTVLRDWARLIVELVLAATVLIWLRLVIHLGLLEEVIEAVEGPPVVCANCGRSTPRGSFCGECGTALRALPKGIPGRSPATGATPPTAPSGEVPA